MKFRVLVKGQRNIITLAIIGGTLLALGLVNFWMTARNLKWLGTIILFLSFFSWLARWSEWKKIYSIGFQIALLILLLYLAWMLYYIIM